MKGNCIPARISESCHVVKGSTRQERMLAPELPGETAQCMRRN